MKIEFIERQPGNHHVIRTEEGKQLVPRVGELVGLGETIFTVHSILWLREKSAVLVMLDR